MEYSKHGFGIVVDIIEERNGNLHITGRKYFWDSPFGLWYIPSFFTPVVLNLSHEYKADDEYFYAHTLTHPIFGVTFAHKGYFKDIPQGEM